MALLVTKFSDRFQNSVTFPVVPSLCDSDQAQIFVTGSGVFGTYKLQVMNNEQLLLSAEPITDAALVAESLAGDREAFSRIVERYQRLLCSLAYSATGRLSESEDLAQEAFVEAWRRLHTLREPEKLRAWLCGILRYKVSRFHRSDGQQPVRKAEVLEV